MERFRVMKRATRAHKMRPAITLVGPMGGEGTISEDMSVEGLSIHFERSCYITAPASISLTFDRFYTAITDPPTAHVMCILIPRA